MWRYRELLYFLAWRDIRIRYKQTVLGAAWAIIQPVTQTVVFLYFFGHLAGFSSRSGVVPYALHVLSGQLLWTFFSQTVNGCSASLVGSTQLVTKVYFPRLIIPLAAVGVGLVDLAVASVPLLALMAWFRTQASPQLLLLPVVVFLTLCAAAGVGTLLSALTVAYRDVRYVVPFMIQVWFFLSPVVYPDAVIAPEASTWMSVNPMYGLIRAFRSALFGQPLDAVSLAISGSIGLLALLVGVFYFRSVERRFADVI